MNEHKNDIDEVKIVPSTGGVFEVELDGKNIFSKKDLDRFPEDGEVENLIKKEM